MSSPAPVPWVDPPAISDELEQAVREKQTTNNASAAALRLEELGDLPEAEDMMTCREFAFSVGG